MMILVNVKDEKADALLEILKGLSFVKTETLSKDKTKALKGFKESVDQVNLDKQGKIKLPSIHSLLDEN
ncbi:hypothetical protein FH581_020255 [Leptospira weilii]|uniref:hypothetical protein n=1 Tax=Leptospira weilii TaxID=28184 RepID=UPI001EF377D6|nr:hypothetical protein [Leptospira weilii]ULH27704.1 hypothetical protein FH586_15030 [Leptospira weilii]ULH27711.1 hypothetical protein FH586_15070 [Leptospira weilii]UPY76976.1 hypothetical protein FH581_013630 [Leptospira weilii]UPY76992.1 hypothetical protein FH581_013710 [Leptospira weilii]UPY80425.1 hypothetical protein FH581_020255 [Leptospira weilii]